MIKLKPETSGKPVKGSKSPGIGYLYVVVLLFLAIASGTLLSGGFVPVDPNSPAGPPTLAPYWNEFGQDGYEIIFPSATIDPKNNLQLKTFKVNVCGSTSVINFLIDTSGSMIDDNKIYKLRDGLRTFTKKLAPSAVIGMQTFSSVVQERVRLDYYSRNKVQVIANIENLNAGGWTRMRDGFQLAKTVLADAITKNRFPGYKYYLVVLGDGVPETPDATKSQKCQTPPGIVPDPLWDNPPGSGNGIRCFDPEQNPLGAPSNPINLARDIKNLGAEIYTVGIFSPSAISDQTMKPYLETLFRTVASDPVSEHYYGTQLENVNLEEVLKNLTQALCQDDLGGDDSTTPTPRNYPFPTFPHGDLHPTYPGPGGQFN
jgi:hypothetical protein